MSDFPAGVTLGLLPPRAAERAEPRFVAAPITAQYAVAPEHYLMRLRDAAIARGGPGQFVMINPTRQVDVHPLLPRPMAIYRYLPASDENYGYYDDPKETELHDKLLHESDPQKQRALMVDFQKLVMDTEAHATKVIWWNRIVPYRSYVKGWKISPSHFVNQDLATIWLDK